MIGCLGCLPASAQTCSSRLPFLGIGLGYNQYSVEQVQDIGSGNECQMPMVYNWGPGPSPQQPMNLPHLDFPERFVPMQYGCSEASLLRLFEAIEQQDYSGPLLVFNEPDRQDQANCSPDRAVEVFQQLVEFRDAYRFVTKNELMLVVGGVAEPTAGITWMNQFLDTYKNRYGAHPLQDNLASAVHFHLYPQFAYDNGEQAFLDIVQQLQIWQMWLKENNVQAWVTEVGVLNAPFQPISEEEFLKFLDRSLTHLSGHHQIEHAFVFTLNSVSGTKSEDFVKTALIRDGRETDAYRYISSLCQNPSNHFCNAQSSSAEKSLQSLSSARRPATFRFEALTDFACEHNFVAP